MPSEVLLAGTPHGREPTAQELKRELTEAREQQAATAEILSVVANSPTDEQQVFGAIAVSAVRLCAANDATIHKLEGSVLRLVAHHGPIPAEPALPPIRGIVVGRAVLDRQTLHVDDLPSERTKYPEGSDSARRLGFRTVLGVPLIRAGQAIGAIAIRRTEVRPFTDRQVTLLKAFADHAVIAIENARLFQEVQARTKELAESLEYQTATSDVLGVISPSPNQLQPVLDAIVETAFGLCPSDGATIMLREADRYRFVASAGFAPEEITDRKERAPVPVDRGSVVGRVALEGRTIHVHDVKSDPDYTLWPSGFRRARRTVLGVPLVRDGSIAGVIILFRAEVEAYSQRQIELVETFADQAVIAMSNARLFEEVQARTHELTERTQELTETLEYQTATSEVLSVISRSPAQLLPVLDAIAKTAGRLCRADNSVVYLLKEGKCHPVAFNKNEAEFIKYVSENPIAPGQKGSVTGTAVAERRTVHVPDTLVDVNADYGSGIVTISKNQSVLSVPLLRDGVAIGAITVARRLVEPFDQRQIQLVTTFADQAVIAIENTRLFEAEQASKRELQESLEYQTAISDVLGVISRSPNKLQPVFDVIVQTASRLCHAENAGFALQEGGKLRVVSTDLPESNPLRGFVINRPFAVSRESTMGRAAFEKRLVHVPDVLADPEWRDFETQRVLGNRTTLAVPLLQDGRVIAVISMMRRVVQPFSDKQIRLVQTFADQAVIAIENTRLFEAEQASKRELQAKSAARLCETEDASIFRRDGDRLLMVAHHGSIPFGPVGEFSLPLIRGTVSGRSVLDARTVHVADLQSESREYPEGSEAARKYGHRTALSVPLVREGIAIGMIGLRRTKVQLFSEPQVALLQTFADQAVIAIENTRLFQEVQARNRDLIALGEVGRAVSSTLDLKIVLKTIVERAVDLSGTDGGSIFYYREDVGAFELGETSGLDEEVAARFRKLDISAGQTGLGEAIANRHPDVSKRPSNPLRDAALEAGLRAALIVPLLGAEGPLGTLVLQRRRSGEFTQAVVSLMQSFADQSAIALENARLFEEIARKSRELEIASQHKSQFVANMSHELRTPLAAILGYAELMQEGFYEPLARKSLDALTRIRSNGKHLLGLINTVLDIAKIESGQFTLNMAEYAIESVVETVRSATESLAQNKKLTFKTEVAKSLPVGLGDEQRLTQVLLNLVGNAIKFTDTGEVRVTAKAVNGYFVVSVTDTGPGIPEDHQTRIFDQFHQVDSTNTKAKGGTGLGLAIAKQIVEMHGGRIWVESTLGKGSTFQMELPTRAATG
jgi:GAF domain-containing protein/anti-sigma regulatory factor (Ser/Thr protein kinase)